MLGANMQAYPHEAFHIQSCLELQAMEAAVRVMKQLIDYQVLDIIAAHLEHSCSELQGICSAALSSSQGPAAKTASPRHSESCQNGATPQQFTASEHVLDAAVNSSRSEHVSEAVANTSENRSTSLLTEAGRGVRVQRWLRRLGRWSSVNDEGICSIPQEGLLDWVSDILTHGLAEGQAALDCLLHLNAEGHRQTAKLAERLLKQVKHVQRVGDAARHANQTKIDTEVRLSCLSRFPKSGLQTG